MPAAVLLDSRFVLHTIFIAVLLTLGYISGASVRVFLYAYLFAELGRVPLAWIALSRDDDNVLVQFLRKHITIVSKGRHWYEKEPVYVITRMNRHNIEYTLIAFAMFLFVGFFLVLAGTMVYGSKIAGTAVLIPELSIALCLGFVLLAADVMENQIQFDTSHEVFINIELNLRGMGYLALILILFLVATPFIGASLELEMFLVLGLSSLKYFGDKYLKQRSNWVPST